MLRLALTVTAETLLGADLDETADAVNAAMADLATTLHAGAGPWTAVTERLPWPAPSGVCRSAAWLAELIDALIDERLRRPARPPTLLDTLLAELPPGAGRPARQPVHDQVLTLLLAGRETLAASLIWTWWRLGRTPEVEAALHAELDRALAGRLPGPGDLPRLAFARQVFAESLRCHPPAWVTARRAVAACPAGGTALPEGAVVLLSQYVVHHDPSLWPDPWRFEPGRWVAGRPAGLPRGAYFPFGAGPRRCLGEAFAWQMAVLHLATVGAAWRLRPLDDGPVPVVATTSLQPRGGLHVRTERRPARPQPPAGPSLSSPCS
jgi:cytochrome P450